VELCEPREDTGGRHGEALKSQDERDRGGLLKAGELKGASLRGLVLLFIFRRTMAVKG
jgi:hypothetical protein